MKITRSKPQDSQTERYLIISFIMSENVLRALKKAYDKEFFQSKMTKEVSTWCFDFFKDYDTAPKQEIETIFNMKSKSGKIEPDLEDEINKFLISLSEEWEEWEGFNEQYYIELGFRYFKKRSYSILSDQIKEAANSDDIEEADRRYSHFTKVQEELSQSRYLLEESGQEALKQSLSSKSPILFELPGAAGQMIGPIERSTMIGLLGREKVGKTYHLMMFVMAALKHGLNVAMLETGDLTQDQLDLRFNSRFTRKVSREKEAGEKFIPVLDCLYNQTGECSLHPNEPVVGEDDKGIQKFNVDVNDPDIIESHDRCIECWKDRFLRYTKFKGSIWWEKKNLEMWSWNDVSRATKHFKKYFKGNLVTEAFPMQTMKASDIRDWCINKQKQEGFIPDVLVVDYPDILFPENNKEYRHQENEKWMILRQISQEFHNCVIIPTQADAKSYNRDTIQLDNYSEDKRKYAHVTHFFAINKNLTEENLGCSRLSTLILRESSVKITQQVTLLNCLEVANTHLASFFGRIPAL